MTRVHLYRAQTLSLPPRINLSLFGHFRRSDRPGKGRGGKKKTFIYIIACKTRRQGCRATRDLMAGSVKVPGRPDQIVLRTVRARRESLPGFFLSVLLVFPFCFSAACPRRTGARHAVPSRRYNFGNGRRPRRRARSRVFCGAVHARARRGREAADDRPGNGRPVKLKWQNRNLLIDPGVFRDSGEGDRPRRGCGRFRPGRVSLVRYLRPAPVLLFFFAGFFLFFDQQPAAVFIV